MLGVPSYTINIMLLYIDMLGVPSLHHEHHAIYIDMLGVPSLHHEHHAIYIDIYTMNIIYIYSWECLAYTINIM